MSKGTGSLACDDLPHPFDKGELENLAAKSELVCADMVSRDHLAVAEDLVAIRKLALELWRGRNVGKHGHFT